MDDQKCVSSDCGSAATWYVVKHHENRAGMETPRCDAHVLEETVKAVVVPAFLFKDDDWGPVVRVEMSRIGRGY